MKFCSILDMSENLKSRRPMIKLGAQNLCKDSIMREMNKRKQEKENQDKEGEKVEESQVEEQKHEPKETIILTEEEVQKRNEDRSLEIEAAENYSFDLSGNGPCIKDVNNNTILESRRQFKMKCLYLCNFYRI